MLRKFFIFSILLSSHLFAFKQEDLNKILPDPYPSDYETTVVLPFNEHGWYNHAQRFEHLIKEHNVTNVIEVGSWLGASTRHIASLLPEGGKIFAVDTWQGSPENVLNAEHREWLPTLFQQFKSNVIHFGLTDKIIPVRMDSLEAAKKLKKLKLKIDLIYIDGAHDYKSVYNDLCAWYPFIEESGTMTGDDWHYGDIQDAVTRFAKENKLKIISDNNFWRLAKP